MDLFNQRAFGGFALAPSIGDFMKILLITLLLPLSAGYALADTTSSDEKLSALRSLFLSES